MKLLESVEIKNINGETQKEIRGVAYHTNQVKEGFLFTAIRGMEVDGHQFIPEAIRKGAEAILLEEDHKISEKTTIVVPNSRKALAKISANFYDHPSSRVTLVGITGTNGKTTTTYLLEAILKKAGYSVGVIGTVNYRFGQRIIPAPNTTPESLDLQRILWEMVKEGITHVIMEVSSHGLDLDRVLECQFDGAIFTNLTSEHLDYHKTLTHYFESKKKLFSEFLIQSRKKRKFAVTNVDDPRGEEIIREIDTSVVRYGLYTSCDVSANQISSTFEGLSCLLKTPKGEFFVHSKLIGEFNIYNILAAVATTMAMDLPMKTIQEGIESLEGVPGRFEKIENPKGIHVIVDYAHTHDALEHVLIGLKKILENSPKSNGKMITVFGCGGDRDRAKRPLMGKVAATYSDLSILTSDNPRTEDPIAIIKGIEDGFRSISLLEWKQETMGAWRSKKGYMKIPDRREAIRLAIKLAQPSDTVLIAGKGHEDYQIIGKNKFPFDDHIEAKKALEER